MVSVTIDNFNRANGYLDDSRVSSSGLEWSGDGLFGDPFSNWQISNGDLTCTTFASSWITRPFDSDQEIYCVINDLPDVGDYVILYSRITNTASPNGYYLIYLQTGDWQIRRLDAGSPTILNSATQAINPGDKISLSATGSSLVAKRYTSSWSTVVSATDTTYSTSGYVGIGGQGAAGTLLIGEFGGGPLYSEVLSQQQTLYGYGR